MSSKNYEITNCKLFCSINMCSLPLLAPAACYRCSLPLVHIHKLELSASA